MTRGSQTQSSLSYLSQPHFCFTFFFNMFLFVFQRERGRGRRERNSERVRVRERNLNRLPSAHNSTNDCNHNLGMCPVLESTWRPFGAGDDPQPTEAYQPGPHSHIEFFLLIFLTTTYLSFQHLLLCLFQPHLGLVPGVRYLVGGLALPGDMFTVSSSSLAGTCHLICHQQSQC